MYENKQLFDFMLRRVHEVGASKGLRSPQAFGRWFAEMYFDNPQNIYISDGSGDAKIDLFFTTSNGKGVEHCIVNTKYTEKYDALAPVAFYNEINAFWQAFANEGDRATYLSNIVRQELRPHYKKLFQQYDQGSARLYFVTNSRRNEKQIKAIESCDVKVFHLEDILQFMVDYIEDAMPQTHPLLLTGINSVLSVDLHDSDVPTAIIFARLADFIKYMDDDPYDLLFARNVRLSLGNTPVNIEIRDTFKDSPKEFAYSNNGITILCEEMVNLAGAHEVRLTNPRIVNGSQTLHSIRDVPKPSSSARVMVRVIQVPALKAMDLPSLAEKRKKIINKISIRSNRQNNIKKWDLVSNDDFQHELARHFRANQFYYERRQKEWSSRKTQLRSLGIRQGPGIKRLTQLIASFYWDKKLLGPVAARRELGQLFDGSEYDVIKETNPEEALQIYLLDCVLNATVRELSEAKQYISNMATHMRHTLFALVVRALQSANANWGSSEFTKVLTDQLVTPDAGWRSFAKQSIDHIATFYKADAKRYKQDHGLALSFVNYFKSQTYVGKIFDKPLPVKLRTAAKALL